MKAAEQVAMELECDEPGITDAGYLAEIKATVVEVCADRLYDYRGRDRLRDYLKARGYGVELGFPDNPTGCDLKVDLLSYASIKGVMDRFWDRVYHGVEKIRDANRSAVTLDFSDLLERACRKRDEEFARRNSPEGLAANEKEYAEWWAILDFSGTVVAKMKEAVSTSNHDELITLGMRIRAALLHWKLPEKPRAEAALHRAMGLIEESAGRTASAIAEYQAAVNIDSKAGCQRDLNRLVR